MRPGSFAWLLRHDLRLGWRDFRAGFGRLGARGLAGLAVLLLAVMHAAVWGLASEAGALAADPARRGEAEALVLPAAGFVLLLMLAQTLNGSTKLLYGRGDLDLLLSSPASPRRVLGARALAVAVGALASAAVFVLPVADDALVQGHPRLLAVYPALVGGALLAAAAGLAATMALFRALGPRRTRLAAQVLATFVGAGFFLSLQFRNLLPELWPSGALADGGGLRAALSLPGRAALGDPGALAAWLAIAVAAFAAAALALGPGFARGAALAAGAAAPGAARRARSARRLFVRGPLPGLRLKEWRLIARDPWVVSQVLLQILYMTPLIALMWTGNGAPALGVAPMIVVITFQVSSSLTWLGLSGEDAPDLLASAPVPAALLRRGKLQAVGALALALVAPPLLYLLTVSPPDAAIAAALAAVGLGAAVLLQGWHGAPGRRSSFAARHRESKLMGLVEMAMSVLLGLGTALCVLRQAWALAPLLLAGALVLWMRPRRRGHGAP
ncbi:hypothetical protein [Lichenibacterium dinghuense]|uniref:hypothetical protein n=1 Tax=Lichenibacterium dinghuense TaxID=2895977 RepID=UPI001F438040|nr:hypothetical protein [Lichenibacterium sp. 6Y81]